LEVLVLPQECFRKAVVAEGQATAHAEKVRHPWVAGYNLLNEPTDESPGATRLLDFYTRLAKAVRAVDPDHILCFDGNTFGADFSGFEAAGFTCENSIFSCHDYAT
jgi:endoglucanase